LPMVMGSFVDLVAIFSALCYVVAAWHSRGASYPFFYSRRVRLMTRRLPKLMLGAAISCVVWLTNMAA
jgi:hypothetical protein